MRVMLLLSVLTLSAPFIIISPHPFNHPSLQLLPPTTRPLFAKKKKNPNDDALKRLEEIERMEATATATLGPLSTEDDIPLSGKELKRLAKMKKKGSRR